MSHDFEFHASDPQDGYRLTLTNDLSHPAVVSDAAVQRLSLDGEALWNLQKYDPPLWILGVRGSYSTLLASDQALQQNLLPASYYRTLGGSVNLRGFWIQELPKNRKRGGLTSGYVGIEQRLANTLPYGFEPFIFADVGAIGSQFLSFDSPLYSSPGLGMRWKSPIGSFRTTIAQGFSGAHAEGWTWYFRYGEEF
jgi:outer membrane protein assembly factor BamA